MIYALDSCEIDTRLFEVRREGAPVPVEPQVFDLLVLLIENRHRIVHRDEIVESVWNGRIVSEAAISSRIKAARRIIGDDGKSQSMIRTIHRRGIRFVGEVAVSHDPALDHGAEEAATPTTVDVVQPAAPRPTAGAGLPWSTSSSEAEPAGTMDSLAGLDLSLPAQPSLVVLPFNLLNGTENDQVICDGLCLDIMTRLARTRWLFVISRGTAFTFRGATQNAPAVAAKLGVRYVLQGNVHFVGQRIRIHAALTDAVAGREVWAEQFNRDIADIFTLQDDIADVIVGYVESEIELTERKRALMIHPSSLDAWSAYHRGTWHMYQFTPEGYEEAERLLKLASRMDPNASRVYSALSFVHWQRAFLEIGQDREGEISQAFDFARQALVLDPRDPQGHWALGRAFLINQDVEQAVEEIEQSVSLNPNFAIGHYSVGFARLIAGDHAISEVSVQRARRLSPYDLMSFAMLATQATNATMLGDVEKGAAFADRAAGQPNAHYHIFAIAAFCNAMAGREEMASQYLARLKSAHPGYRISDYFRAFPYRNDRFMHLVRTTFRKLGLQD